MDQQNAQASRRRPLKSLAGGTAAALGLGLFVMVGLPLAAPLFPSQELQTCTVTDRPALQSNRRNFFPRAYTDCGTFIAAKEVSCTSDDAEDVALIPGYLYDLEVRGLSVPFLSTPTIVSAQVSATQRIVAPDEPGPANTSDEELNQILDGLTEQSSPEALRAWDYEQPTYDPECEVNRNVMTTAGIQRMLPAQAERLLKVPAGTTPRDPRLPCRGFQCGPEHQGKLPDSGRSH